MRKDSPKLACLVVVGMHRSGTSAVAGTLGILGAQLPKDLLGSNDFNPKGHFESLAVIALNDRLLEELGSCWYDIREIGPTIGWTSWDQSRARFADVLQASFDCNPSAPFVLKDPRICRLLPLILASLRDLGATPYLVLCVRNPLEVAQSLEKRDGISLRHGLTLWLRYMLDAEFYSRGHPRVFIGFSEFLQDWRSAIKTIEQRLEIVLPENTDSAAVAVDAFLDRSLQHNVASTHESELCFEAQEWIVTCFRALTALVRDPGDKQAMRQLDETRSAFGLPANVFGPVITAYYGELREIWSRLATFENTPRDLSRAAEGAAVAELVDWVKELKSVNRANRSTSWRLWAPLPKLLQTIARARRPN